MDIPMISHFRDQVNSTSWCDWYCSRYQALYIHLTQYPRVTRESQGLLPALSKAEQSHIISKDDTATTMKQRRRHGIRYLAKHTIELDCQRYHIICYCQSILTASIRCSAPSSELLKNQTSRLAIRDHANPISLRCCTRSPGMPLHDLETRLRIVVAILVMVQVVDCFVFSSSEADMEMKIPSGAELVVDCCFFWWPNAMQTISRSEYLTPIKLPLQ